MFSKIAIIRRNKPEAVILPIEEYELLQSAYARLEDDKQISKTKTLSIDI